MENWYKMKRRIGRWLSKNKSKLKFDRYYVSYDDYVEVRWGNYVLEFTVEDFIDPEIPLIYGYIRQVALDPEAAYASPPKFGEYDISPYMSLMIVD